MYGQIGWELQRSLSPLGDLVALGRDSGEYCGDLTNLAGIADTVRRVAPDIIVNAAAYTAVDRAESEPELARLVNASAPAVLAQEAQKLGAWLVHYSTDYVFDGSGDQPRLETDPTGPLSVYGKTKLEGEVLIQQNCEKHLIFRTSWVYASRGANFARSMLHFAKERDRLRVVDDQIGAPTSAELLADVTAHAVQDIKTRDDHSGIYHLTAAGETSWYGYAKFLIESAKVAYPILKLDPRAIEAIPSEAFPTAARRPLNSRLNTNKLKSTFNLHLPDWHDGVTRVLTELL
ncbi:dTDP-4-dehydrorhamnose reductase [Methylophilaceae bacterium]|nr:dTDP-4-dehydrorhamnose reductase [Methylophilaceae bacterium]